MTSALKYEKCVFVVYLALDLENTSIVAANYIIFNAGKGATTRANRIDLFSAICSKYLMKEFPIIRFIIIFEITKLKRNMYFSKFVQIAIIFIGSIFFLQFLDCHCNFCDEFVIYVSQTLRANICVVLGCL